MKTITFYAALLNLGGAIWLGSIGDTTGALVSSTVAALCFAATIILWRQERAR